MPEQYHATRTTEAGPNASSRGKYPRQTRTRTGPPERPRRASTPVLILTFIALIAGLRATQFVTMPIAAAFFIVTLLWPLQKLLETRMPRWSALCITSFTLLGLVAAFAGATYAAFSAVVESLPESEELASKAEGYLKEAQRVIPSAGRLDPSRLLGSVAEGAGNVLSTLVTRAGVMVTTAILTMLTLLEASSMRERLQNGLRYSAGLTYADVASMAQQFRDYMWTKSFVSILTGLATAGVCWIAGVPLPFVWGFLAFLLNYIPNLGSLIAIVPPVIMAWFVLGIFPAMGVFAALTVLQILLGQFIDPLLQARSLSLSPTLVLVSVLFGGWVWGAGGALLAVPMTAAGVIIARRSRRFAWLADLLSNGHENGSSPPPPAWPRRADDEEDGASATTRGTFVQPATRMMTPGDSAAE